MRAPARGTLHATSTVSSSASTRLSCGRSFRCGPRRHHEVGVKADAQFLRQTEMPYPRGRSSSARRLRLTPAIGFRAIHSRENLASETPGRAALVLPVPAGSSDRGVHRALGRGRPCRSCRSEYLRRWRALNPEHVAVHNHERRLAYRERHPLKTRPWSSAASRSRSAPTRSSAAPNVAGLARSSRIESVGDCCCEVVGCRTDRTKGGVTRHPQVG